MNKFQPNISFKDINHFLDHLPPAELKIVEMLRCLVLESLPGCREKLSYNVPFYYGHSRICFIWPSSVPWGNVRKEGVEFGFCRGHLLADPSNYLDKGERKQVYTKTFLSTAEIDSELLLHYLSLAHEVDLKLSKK